MDTYPSSPALRRMRDNWGWYLALGAALALLGLICLGAAYAATIATVVIFGIATLVAGVVIALSAIWAGSFWGAVLRLAGGILFLVAGFYLIVRPLGGAAALTIGIALFLIIAGIVQIVTSSVEHGHGWGWGVASGVLGVILGIFLWVGWPLTAYVAIGVFVGIEILFSGVSLMVSALTARTYGLPGSRATPMA